MYGLIVLAILFVLGKMSHRDRLSAAKRLLSELYDDVPEVCDSCCQTESDGYALVNGQYKLISMADFAHASGTNLVSQIQSLLQFAKGASTSPVAAASTSPVTATPPPAPSRREITTDEIMMMLPEENEDWHADSPERPVVEDVNEPYESDVTGTLVPSPSLSQRGGQSKRMTLMKKLAELEGVKTRNTRELLQMYKGITIPQLYELITNAQTRGPVFTTDSGIAALADEEYRELSQDKKHQYIARLIEIFNKMEDKNRPDMKSFARSYSIPYSTFVEHYKGRKPNAYINYSQE